MDLACWTSHLPNPKPPVTQVVAGYVGAEDRLVERGTGFLASEMDLLAMAALEYGVV